MFQAPAAGKVWPVLAAIAGIALFCALGFWQLERYELKQDLFQAFERAVERSPRTVTELERLDALDPYTPVELSGRYDLSRQIMLDNRIRDGRVGVEVFTPLRLDSGGAVLVNRGWLPMERQRRRLPHAPGPQGPMTVSGLAAPPPATGIQLGEVGEPDSWPWLTPYLIPDLAQEALGLSLPGKVVLLDPEAPGGFLRDWAPGMLPPERHLGYAVQWFALALTAAVVWVLLTVKQGKQSG